MHRSDLERDEALRAEVDGLPEFSRLEVPEVEPPAVAARVYREYVQLVRTGDGWRIVNALWAWTQ